MPKTDVLFYCNAGAQVGFGHLRRCLFLAEAITSEDDVRCAFGGDYSADAQKLIRQEQPASPIWDDEQLREAHVGVVILDYMYDEQDPEFYDDILIARIASCADVSVVLTSSRTAPSELPVDVVIGHLLDPDAMTSYTLKAGLRYAPVSPEVQAHRPSFVPSHAEVERVFLGVGNSSKSSVLHLALHGLEHAGYTRHVDILLSPSHRTHADSLYNADHSFQLDLHHNVPSVPPLLSRADVMIGTYGHMTYEALALGVPTVVVGTKRFMVEYAQRLADKNLVVSAGHVDDLDTPTFGQVLARLNANRREVLSQNTLGAVDGKGLKRVAEEIVDLLSGGKTLRARH